MARRAARVDGNQQEIVKTLRTVGATVQSLASVGQGVPDLLVGFRGRNYLLECKVRGGRLTPDELQWHLLWRGEVTVVWSVEDALQAIGAVEAA